MRSSGCESLSRAVSLASSTCCLFYREALHEGEAAGRASTGESGWQRSLPSSSLWQLAYLIYTQQVQYMPERLTLVIPQHQSRGAT